MTNFIGGELEISLEMLSQSPVKNPGALPTNHLVWLDTGRSALYLALQDILKKGGSRQAWLPAYCCGSILMPFKKLGFEIHFYSLSQSLKDPKGLPHRLDNQVFLYIHYFGKKNEQIESWLKTIIYEGDKFFIIEDAVQASLNTNIGLLGDYTILSYRKFLPVPDGAVLASKKPIDIDINLEMPNEGFISRKFVGKILRQFKTTENVFLELFEASESIIDERIVLRNMSWLSHFLIERLDIRAIGNKRRKNFEIIGNLLQKTGLEGYRVSPIFTSLDQGEVPLGFPVTVCEGKRDDLRSFLFRKNIFCAVHWNVDYLGTEQSWSDERELSRQILTLPIDQRLNEKSLAYLTNSIKEYYTNGTN